LGNFEILKIMNWASNYRYPLWFCGATNCCVCIGLSIPSFSFCIFTWRRSWSFAGYCKHFVARLNDVHAFGYNSAGSKLIWMKFGDLRVCYLELSLTNFWRDPRRSGSGSASRNFFCPLNNARFHKLPIGQISRNLHKKTCFRVRMCRFKNICENLPVRGLYIFPKKTPFLLDQSQRFPTSGRDFSEIITNLGKSWQVRMPVECWLSIDIVGMNSKWFSWPVTPAHGEQFFPQKYSSTTAIGDDFTACATVKLRRVQAWCSSSLAF